MKITRSQVAATVCALLVVFSGVAAAQSAAQPVPASGGVDAAVRTENGRRVYVASTTIEVRGEIQRPYAFSVSGRSSLGYTYFDQPIQFLQLIIDAVRRAPF
jgi:hypothetical protein